MFTSRHLLHAAFAGVFLTAAAMPLAAQDTRARGTVTLDKSPDRVQVLTTRRARLGVLVRVEVSPQTDTIGAELVAVTPNGPAARAGLQAGDIVTRFNGKLLTATSGSLARSGTSVPGLRLVELAAAMAPGDSSTVQYRRGNTLHQTTLVTGDEPGMTWSYSQNGRTVTGIGPLIMNPPQVTPGAYDFTITLDSGAVRRGDSLRLVEIPRGTTARSPMSRAFMFSSTLGNVELAPLNPELGAYFGTTQGVLVINLPKNSTLGLKPGDVVLSVDDRVIRSPGQLFSVLMTYGSDEPVQFQVMRQKSRKTVTGRVGES